ncbi:MAG TPA: PAS domain S-box protein [Spirochaetota bacterium]|nr:PAS domain S-box protein [Spirochaetota bacterium]
MNEKQKTILLVEDDRVISLFKSKELSDFGYNVITVDNGDDAIKQAIENKNINLILMDIDLGDGIDGTEAAKKILSVKDIPIIFHTSHIEEEFVYRVRKITRYGYVIKNSGGFVLKSSIEMAFELYEANKTIQNQKEDLLRTNEELQQTIEELISSNEELITAHNELNQSKEKAEENESLLIAALENSQAGIAIADVPSGKLRYVNKSGLLIRNKEYNEIVKDIDVDKYVESWKILNFDKTPLNKDEVPLARAVLYGETNTKEFIVGRDNEEDRYVLANAAPVVNKQGKQIAAIVVFLDITEKKQAEFELQRTNENLQKEKETSVANEEKFRFLFENMTQGVIFHSSEGKIIDANNSSAKILGLSLDQLFGLTSFDPRWRSIHEDGTDYPGDTHPVMITLKTGKPVLNSKMGVFNPQINNYNWININSIPKFKNNEDKPSEVIVTFEDITEIIERENIIKKLLKEKEMFLKEVHHRIKNNLNLIINILNLQISESNSIDTQNSLIEAKNRVLIMSEIYEKLYVNKKTSDFNLFDFRCFLKSDVFLLTYSFS